MDAHDSIDTLNQLIETCKDGEYGFDRSAEQLRSLDAQHLFTRRAVAYHDAARELQDLVQQLGGKAAESGHLAATLHRGWVAVKAKLAETPDAAILEAAENGERCAKQRYEQALATSLPPPVRAVVEHQYSAVLRSHAQLRALREDARGVVGVDGER